MKSPSTFAFGLASSRGAWPVQEDGYVADPVHGFFALADGFGGRGAGDIAAKLALRELRAERVLPPGTDFAPALRKQREAFGAAHKSIVDRNRGRPSAGRGGASLLVAEITGSSLLLTQCGACGALLVRAGRIHPVLLPQAAVRQEFQPVLPQQALGLGEQIQPESRALDFSAGDVLVLFSGGVEWESESFQLELSSQLSVRERGGDLSPAATHVIENGSLSAQSWNRTLLLVEQG